jgi:hypothetical protein
MGAPTGGAPGGGPASWARRTCEKDNTRKAANSNPMHRLAFMRFSFLFIRSADHLFGIAISRALFALRLPTASPVVDDGRRLPLF